MTLKFLALALLASTVSACMPKWDVDRIRYYKDVNLSDLLASGKISCDVDQKCPQNIGVVGAKGDFSITSGVWAGVCTGFLVADDLVMTDSHCVPDVLKEAGSSQDCGEHLQIRFPSASDQGEIFQCKKLVFASDITKSKGDADYAFFKIAPTGRTPLKLARAGLHSDRKMSIVRFSPEGAEHPFSGSINREENCKIAFGSLLSPNSVGPYSPQGLILGCAADHGNSGSPLFDDHGDVAGILQLIVDPKKSAAFVKGLNGIKTPTVVPGNVTVTNISCIDGPEGLGKHRPECETAATMNFFSCSNNPRLEEISNSQMSQWVAREPNVFRYHFERSEDGLEFQARPMCVNREIYEQRRPSVVEYSALGYIEMQLQTNEQFVLKPEIQIKTLHEKFFTANLTFVDDHIHFHIQDDTHRFDDELEFCTPEQLQAPDIYGVRLDGNKSISLPESISRRQRFLTKANGYCE